MCYLETMTKEKKQEENRRRKDEDGGKYDYEGEADESSVMIAWWEIFFS